MTDTTSNASPDARGGSKDGVSSPVTVLVVGGSGGIGRALDDLVSELTQQADEAGLPLRGLANCAGSILLKPAHLTSAVDFETTLRQNLHTAFATVRAAGRHLRTGGSVLLFSSGAARLGLQSHEALAAAKAGVQGLVRAASATYATRGLRVNAVAPGLVAPPWPGISWGPTPAEKLPRPSTPWGAWGNPTLWRRWVPSFWTRKMTGLRARSWESTTVSVVCAAGGEAAPWLHPPGPDGRHARGHRHPDAAGWRRC